MNNLFNIFFAFTLSWLLIFNAQAQFDDVYYDPSDDWSSSGSYSDYDPDLLQYNAHPLNLG